MARVHFQTALAPAGGEGAAIAALVDGFIKPDPENLAPVNLGQLKNATNFFYIQPPARGRLELGN